jgi:inorganic pyrophosphatase
LDTIDITIETPKGSTQKYKHDPATGQFRVKKLLPSGMCFPFDFGFIPGTRADDGDPLDVLLISEAASFTGCVIEARIIGGFSALQWKPEQEPFHNDRIFAVAEASHEFAGIRTMQDLPPKLLEQLQYFFVHYNFLEGKQFNPQGILSEEECWQMIRDSKT